MRKTKGEANRAQLQIKSITIGPEAFHGFNPSSVVLTLGMTPHRIFRDGLGEEVTSCT